MNYSEVKELLQAGFTADEIRGMLTADNPQNPQINSQAENTNNSETVQENNSENQLAQTGDQPGSVQDPAGAPAGNTNNPNFNQLNATMEKLIKTIQSSNFNNSSFDKMSETDINTEVDKIMAGLIRPEREQKGGN